MDDRTRLDRALGVEPLPADCLPPPAVLDAVLRGPALDAAGRIDAPGTRGHGMTPAEAAADRELYRYLVGE